MNLRVCVLFHRIGPYHEARLCATERLLPLVAIQGSESDRTYDWSVVEHAGNYPMETLFPDEDSRSKPVALLNRRLRSVLEGLAPGVVVVPGWGDNLAYSALAWCVKKRIPAVVMSESTAWDEERTWWKEWVKRRIVGLFGAALVGGRPHAEYITTLGMSRDRIFQGYDAVDNEYFGAKAAESRKQKTEIRNKYGLPENYFLASARFVEKKNLLRLLEAYARYRALAKAANGKQQTEIWDLVLLGDGPLRDDLCRLVADLGLRNSVQLPGFKQYPDLPLYYGLASAFVHASTTEQWGLVINEAMASGLPVLVSNRCGCAPDLVQEGANGFTFDPYDVEQLANLLVKVSAFNFPRSAFGDASRRIIADWGTERFAQGLKAAAEMAVAVGPKRASWLDRALLYALSRRGSQ